MGQDIASACGQLVLKKQDNNKTNHATNNSTSNNNSNDKKSSYNTSIEIEDFISKQKAKLTHATYNNNNTSNNNTTTNSKVALIILIKYISVTSLLRIHSKGRKQAQLT